MSLKRAFSILYWTTPTAVLLTNLYTVKIISGPSMQPNLNPDSSLLWRDVGIFDRRAIYKGHHQRGDIVVLKSPENAKHEIVKRIIGVAGDTIQTLAYALPEVQVPVGSIWVEGDSIHSLDSNSFGPVPLGLVDSRLVCLIWPVWRIGSQTGSAMPSARRRVTPAAGVLNSDLRTT
ncbi:peptidase S24/S26A/S26B/S26C [Mycena sanguinolenta]|nr:peptidase S24/S26A/S26B/S26C [Mycena sanguinolenta]